MAHFPSSLIPGSALSVMSDHLKETMNATDDELAEMKKLMDIRMEKNAKTSPNRSFHSTPSVVLDDFLYHGDLGHACNMKLLDELGIRHIVNVCDCPLDASMEEHFNILWINLNDDLKEDIKKHFDRTNEFILQCKEKNEKVLVHCQMGISRSSSIVLAYLMKYHHNTLREAYEHLLDRRRVASPNLAFLLQLLRYERELRDRKEIDEKKSTTEEENPIKPMDPVKDPAIPEEGETNTF